MEKLKKCRACQEEKPLQQFKASKGCSGGHSRTCKACFSERYKEKSRKRAKLRYMENPEIFKERTKLYAKNNPEKMKEIYRNRNNSPAFRARRNLRTRLKRILKTCGEKYDCSVGCSTQQLKAYLESKFQQGMTWENYGVGKNCWHIDHIKPLDLFDLTRKEERAAANNFTNLQPLWHKHNEAKSNNYDPDHPMGWRGLDALMNTETAVKSGDSQI